MRRNVGRNHPRRGMTLIEVLVVIAIIGLLVALLLPALQSAREAARRASCTNKLRQIGIACQVRHDSIGSFPSGFALRNLPIDDITSGWGWGLDVLPSLEHASLHNAANQFVPISLPANRTVVETRLSSFVCPSSARGSNSVDWGYAKPRFLGLENLAPAQFIGSAGSVRDGYNSADQSVGSGVLFVNSKVSASNVTDGLSNTLLVGERNDRVADATWVGTPWIGMFFCTKEGWPVKSCASTMYLCIGRTGAISAATTQATGINAPNADADRFGSQHPGGANFLRCDGSVRFVRDAIAPNLLIALGSRSGGEIVDLSD